MTCSLKDNCNSYIYTDIEEIVNRQLPWEQLANKHVLITGASGFIGYYLVSTLLYLNDTFNYKIKVQALVRNKNRAQKKFGELLKRDDLCLLVQDICQPIRCNEPSEYIIHAASQASAAYFENDPIGTINANLSGTINVLEHARKCGNPQVLFISSLKVYGTVKNGFPTLKEDYLGYLDSLSYKNCYAQGKRTSETLCVCYIKQHSLNIKIARPSYIYGASSFDDDRVWAQFISNIVKNENILLKSNGAAYRSFCYVSDTVAALFTILFKGEDGLPYNIAESHSNITIRNMARQAINVFPEKGLKLSFLNKDDEKEPEIDYKHTTPEILDSSRLHDLGWKAYVDIFDGVQRAVNILERDVDEYR